MSQINISNLTFAYDGSYDNIFENVSFTIDTDWRLGFTGRNGRGKTTFLMLLQGKYEYQGKISSSTTFDYFPFEVADNDRNTIDVVASVCGEFELWQLVRELNLLGVDEEALYRPFSTLSNGEKSKVNLAALFLKENNFLLIDEPTNHLDSDARKIVSDYLKTKKGFILVSHDRSFLDNCVDHILSINKTNIEIQKGNFSSWWQNKQLQDEFEQAENEKLQKDIKKLTVAAKRTAKWSDKVEDSKIGEHAADRGAIGHKAAKMMKRSKSIEARQNDAIEKKSSLLKNIEACEELKIRPLSHHSEKLAELESISIFYGDKRVCEDVNLTVKQGERIALVGKNGSGKSSILKLLLGEDIKYSGSVKLASGLVLSYVSQDTSFLHGSLKDFSDENKLDNSLFNAILRKLDFSRIQLEKNMDDFSGGQKKKVLIAKSLCERANLYIWDEPLNFIDVLSRVQIEELILAHKPTMLFVEHDAAFLEKIATSKIYL